MYYPDCVSLCTSTGCWQCRCLCVPLYAPRWVLSISVARLCYCYCTSRNSVSGVCVGGIVVQLPLNCTAVYNLSYFHVVFSMHGASQHGKCATCQRFATSVHWFTGVLRYIVTVIRVSKTFRPTPYSTSVLHNVPILNADIVSINCFVHYVLTNRILTIYVT